MYASANWASYPTMAGRSLQFQALHQPDDLPGRSSLVANVVAARSTSRPRGPGSSATKFGYVRTRGFEPLLHGLRGVSG